MALDDCRCLVIPEMQPSCKPLRRETRLCGECSSGACMLPSAGTLRARRTCSKQTNQTLKCEPHLTIHCIHKIFSKLRLKRWSTHQSQSSMQECMRLIKSSCRAEKEMMLPAMCDCAYF